MGASPAGCPTYARVGHTKALAGESREATSKAGQACPPPVTCPANPHHISGAVSLAVTTHAQAQRHNDQLTTDDKTKKAHLAMTPADYATIAQLYSTRTTEAPRQLRLTCWLH